MSKKEFFGKFTLFIKSILIIINISQRLASDHIYIMKISQLGDMLKLFLKMIST